MSALTPEKPDIATIYKSWDAMATRMEEAERRLAQADQLNIGLMAENHQLADRLESAERDLRYYRSFSIGMVERLGVISDLINKSTAEVREFAKTELSKPTAVPRKPTDRPQLQPAPEHSPNHELPLEDSITEILAGLGKADGADEVRAHQQRYRR